MTIAGEHTPKISLQPMIPALLAILFASVAGIVWAAAGAHYTISAIAAASFAVAILAVSLRINLPLLSSATSNASAGLSIHASRRNARLMALTYAWGGAAMLAVYSLSGHWWWHSWQYGGGMIAIAAALLAFVHRIGDPSSRLRTAPFLMASAGLAVLQALAAAGGLVFLVSSGKLAKAGVDWPANHIFLFGGLTILSISIIAALTHARLVSH